MSCKTDRNVVCPESTIESANRRNFIKKAALAAAATGFGGTLLGGSKLLPESSARSSCGVQNVTTCTPCHNEADHLALWNGNTAISGCINCPPFRHAIICAHSTGYCCSSPESCVAYGVLNVYNRNCSAENDSVGLFASTENVICSVPPTTAGVYGAANTGAGVLGRALSGAGVSGRSTSGVGVYAVGGIKGVYGYSCAGCGVFGCSINGTGVVGRAEGPSAFPLKAMGYCNRGVFAVDSKGNALVDYTGKNSGTLCDGTLPIPGIQFGVPSSGEGMTSNRTCSAAGKNLQGLCLWTHYDRRVSITNAGKVGIGTALPCSTLCVVGNITGRYGVVGGSASAKGVAVTGTSLSGIGVSGASTSVCGEGGCGTGVRGGSTSGIGVYGSSASSSGVQGSSGTGAGVKGWALSSGGIGVIGLACSPGAVPIIAKGYSTQTANLQQWQKGTTVKSVVNECGWLGLGASSAPTTLHVAGSISARVAFMPCSNKVHPTCYPMENNDFAVFASASSGPYAVTLPPANTATGMIVLVKKTDSTANAVTVQGAGSGTSQDKIEGKASIALSAEYASLTLISNGAKPPGNWFIISNAS